MRGCLPDAASVAACTRHAKQHRAGLTDRSPAGPPLPHQTELLGHQDGAEGLLQRGAQPHQDFVSGRPAGVHGREAGREAGRNLPCCCTLLCPPPLIFQMHSLSTTTPPTRPPQLRRLPGRRRAPGGGAHAAGARWPVSRAAPRAGLHAEDVRGGWQGVHDGSRPAAGFRSSCDAACECWPACGWQPSRLPPPLFSTRSPTPARPPLPPPTPPRPTSRRTRGPPSTRSA